MATEDTWHRKPRPGEDAPTCTHRGKVPSARHGRGLQYRVRWQGKAESFRTQGEANAHWLEVRTTKVISSDATVSELVDRWLATKQGLTPKGLESCIFAAAHVRKALGDRRAETLTETDAREWLAGLTGSSSLRIKALQCLSGALEIGVDTGKLKSNVSRGIKRPKDQRHEAHFLSGPQLVDLATACDEYSDMVLLLGTTGLRVGECVALDVADIDKVRARARVRRSKNGTARDVPVPASVLSRLDLDRPANAPLFTSPGGHRVSPNNWRTRVFAQGVKRAGLQKMRVHDLRHTAASLAIASGADVKKVQAMLGHKSAAMSLDLYGHLFETGMDDVARRMDALVRPEES